MEQDLFLIFVGLYGFLFVVFFKLMTIEKKISSVGKGTQYEPLITVWKFLKQLIFGGASFVTLEVLSTFITPLQQWKSVGIVILVAALNAISNYIKYR